MLLTINHNGEITQFCFTPGQPVDKTKKSIEVECEYNVMKVSKEYEMLLTRSNSFSIITPYAYNVIVERINNFNSEHDEVYNFLNSKEWLLHGNGDFRLDNAKICIDNEEMQICVLVSHDAKVVLDTLYSSEELEFKDYIVLETSNSYDIE